MSAGSLGGRMLLSVGAAAVLATAAIGADILPEDLLSTKGKNADWVEATTEARDHLGKLDFDEPLVQQYLPSIKRSAELVRRIDDFNWKTRTAVEYLENLAADLSVAKLPGGRYAGKQLGFPYWSDAMGRVEAIWLHVPPGYNPHQSYQIFMYYKCGGGIHNKGGKAAGGYRPSVEVANQSDTFHVWSSLSTQVKGRKSADVELVEAMDAICSEFSVDRDRVFLTGYSDGGFTSLWLASRNPHLVAGIVPYCANWQYMNTGDLGLFNVPTLVADGWTDGGYNTKQFVRWHLLRNMGLDITGLWSHHGHNYTGYEDPTEFKMYMDWAKTKRRNLWPKRVRYATWGLSWPRAYWFSIERMIEPYTPAQFDASVKGNRIEVKTWNVGGYKLALSDKLVDPSQDVTVITNGATSYSGSFIKQIVVDLSEPPPGKFVKNASMPGDIIAQIERSSYGTDEFLKIADRRWTYVEPTAADPTTLKRLASWLPGGAKSDSDVTDADIAERNLFLFGGPDINKFTKRIAADLPVKFAKGSFTIGSKVYDQPTHCVRLLHPNPLNPKKYIILYAFNDAETFVKNKHFSIGKETVWGFRSGDCIVSGLRSESRKWGVATDHSKWRSDVYVLGAGWGPPDETPVGEFAEAFDETQMMRLRADAIRDATGADAGLIWDYTPGYQRWRRGLPAGPVSAHDIATFERLPQYVVTGEASGRQLKLIAASAAATTVQVAGEIDPDKTYRLAMSYAGLPAYGVDIKKMPKQLLFRTPEEFLSARGTRLNLAHIKQLPLTISEAVIGYVGEQKKVTPRRISGSLAQYVMNPEDNEFGEFDWLHLGADVSLVRPSGTAFNRRYTLSLGLAQDKDSPQTSPNKPTSTNKTGDGSAISGELVQAAKHFVDENIADQRVDFEFSSLRKSLPVTVSTRVYEFAISADAEGKKISLISTQVSEGVIGRGVLVDVVLRNDATVDLTGPLALAPTTMQKMNPGVWPRRQRDANAVPSSFAGHFESFGEYRKPADAWEAALLLFDGPRPRIDRLTAHGAGYNFGQVALKCDVTVPARSTTRLPLLIVTFERPPNIESLDPLAILDAIKPGLMSILRRE